MKKALHFFLSLFTTKKNTKPNEVIEERVYQNTVTTILVPLMQYFPEIKRYMNLLDSISGINYSMNLLVTRMTALIPKSLSFKPPDFGHATDAYRAQRFKDAFYAELERCITSFVELEYFSRVQLISLIKQYEQLTLNSPDAQEQKVIDAFDDIIKRSHSSDAYVKSSPSIIRGNEEKKLVKDSDYELFEKDTKLELARNELSITRNSLFKQMGYDQAKQHAMVLISKFPELEKQILEQLQNHLDRIAGIQNGVPASVNVKNNSLSIPKK